MFTEPPPPPPSPPPTILRLNRVKTARNKQSIVASTMCCVDDDRINAQLNVSFLVMFTWFVS